MAMGKGRDEGEGPEEGVSGVAMGEGGARGEVPQKGRTRGQGVW